MNRDFFEHNDYPAPFTRFGPEGRDPSISIYGRNHHE